MLFIQEESLDETHIGGKPSMGEASRGVINGSYQMAQLNCVTILKSFSY